MYTSFFVFVTECDGMLKMLHFMLQMLHLIVLQMLQMLQTGLSRVLAPAVAQQHIKALHGLDGSAVSQCCDICDIF